MKCLCCLSEASPHRVMSSADNRTYTQVTSMNLTELQEDQTRICEKCNKVLKDLQLFITQSRKSYYIIKKSNQKPAAKAATSRRSPRKPAAEKVKVVEELSQDLDTCNPLSPADMLVVEEEKILTTETTIPATENSLNFVTSLGTGESFMKKLNQCSSKVWQCDTCGKEFASKFRLVTHVRVHSKEKPFKCEVCSVSFAQGNALKCHRRIHFNERPFVCKFCSKSFTQKTTLKTHMVAKHTGKQIACDEPGCDKKFTRRSFFLIHKKDHLGIRSYPCEHCTKTYKHKSHLTRHVEAFHLKLRHECNFPDCKAVFTTQWTLKMHKFTHSTTESQLPYQCEICHAGFNRRDKWLKHLSKSHPNTTFSIPEALEIPNIKIDNQADEKVLILSSDNIYSIQNEDGTVYQISTMQVVQE